MFEVVSYFRTAILDAGFEPPDSIARCYDYIHGMATTAGNGAAKRKAKLKPAQRQPDFTQAELQAMHRWCIRYRDLVRGRGTPTLEQDARFMRYQRVIYATGVACE